ncbi:MAG: hypothetical protein L0H70_07315 [Xanthomonadales bacterium]|nr:hypothetical protein [Xanthomonadales bacterium]
MSTNKVATPTDRHNEDLNQLIDRGAERLKQGESHVLGATRDAVSNGSERTERALHDATDATAEAAKRASQRAADLRDQGQAQFAKGRAQAEETLDSVMDYVRDHPGKSLAMAVAGGWLVGAILRRRR